MQTAWQGVQGELCSFGKAEIPSGRFPWKEGGRRVGRGQWAKECQVMGQRLSWLLLLGLDFREGREIEKWVSWVPGTKLLLFCELLQFNQNGGTLRNGVAVANTHPPALACVNVCGNEKRWSLAKMVTLPADLSQRVSFHLRFEYSRVRENEKM